MPHSTSPHLLPAAELSGDISSQQQQSNLIRAQIPIHTQIPTATPPQISVESASMIAAGSFAPARGDLVHQAAMTIESEAMQLPDQGHHVTGPFTPNVSPFSTPPSCNPRSPYLKFPQQFRNGMSCNLFGSPMYATDHTPERPRLYNNPHFDEAPNMPTSYSPTTFFHTPPSVYPSPSLPDDSVPELRHFSDDYNLPYGNHTKQEGHFDYPSTWSDASRGSTPYHTGFEDDGPIDRDQPYAQLIYRALLQAPHHTMILRDIYEWFRRYTDKATHSETKGWQNSIRHNLSMNGAFEKVDSPDPTNKGYMWRLTPSALREGVKSTTRYRTKMAHKRRMNPLPQRQMAGAKGGQASQRAIVLRRSHRTSRQQTYHSPSSTVPRSEPYFAGGGQTSEWEDASAYGSSPSCPSRDASPFGSPWGTPSLSPVGLPTFPYHAQQQHQQYDQHYQQDDKHYQQYNQRHQQWDHHHQQQRRDPTSPINPISPMHGLGSHLISPLQSSSSPVDMPSSPVSEFPAEQALFALPSQGGELLVGPDGHEEEGLQGWEKLFEGAL